MDSRCVLSATEDMFNLGMKLYKMESSEIFPLSV